ncbi:MAG TPA: VIT1/CCC1 transporter family protein [Polyangia bacterium]|jgi:VIT1/CCC1 family predicted Fe2+/Mn2+ transporter
MSPSRRRDLRRYRANLRDEIDSAHLYRAMAAHEASSELAQVYVKLAEVEERHGRFWQSLIEKSGGKVGAWRPSWRARTMAWLARRFGPEAVLPTVASLEQMNRHVYDTQPETGGTAMRSQERSHARLLRAIESVEPKGAGGMSGGALARLEGRHRAIGGNALRAAVLGANDGLLSTLSLVMGVAGAALSSKAILITGLAGMLAGAFSMALGEWVSVQSSRELYERQIGVEADELATVPDEEQEELALIYQAKGVPLEEARGVAAHLIKDPASALDALAREEIGVDPKELGGSPWTAAATSFVLFALGALVPVLPFTFLVGTTAIIVSLGASAIGLFVIGAAITLYTGRSLWFSGGRQLLLGLGAAAVTYGLGHLLGVSLGG